MSWDVDPDFAPLLDAVLAAPGRVVKESRAKLVAEHRAGERSFFVKRYRHASVPFRPMKFFFKPSQAHEEWSLARKVESRGIPIVRHVALGERWSVAGLQESVLITEAFAGVPANEAAGVNLSELAAFVDRMARAGVIQEDLHPANLLVRVDPWEIRLVDLHGTRVLDDTFGPERQRAGERMLALLRMSLPIPVPAHVDLLARLLRKEALQKRARRCLKVNRDFSVQSSAGRRWHVRSAALPAIVDAMAEPDAFLERARPLKHGRSSTVAVADGIVIKRYNFKKPLNALKDFFRGSRARRGFVKGYHLELCGIATAAVLAGGDHRVLGLPVRSYLLMEEVRGATDAAQWAGDLRAAAHALGVLLAKLHDEGFVHRDLKETNILFDSAGVPHLIDLDGLKFAFDVAASDAAANLERFAAGMARHGRLSRANVIVFLLSYCRRRRVRPRQLFPSRVRGVR
jgi:tRNA A-37 threonylcarbamoyl transferase component Bud32